jgi:Protein of unknown function (DUF2735)
MEASAKGETAMMNTGVNQGSARIYQFPTGGRAALGGRRYDEAKTELAAVPANYADCCDSWYHAAAIEDEKNGRDH